MTIAWGKKKGKWNDLGQEEQGETAGGQPVHGEHGGAVKYLVSKEGPDMSSEGDGSRAGKTVYVTLTGLPLTMKFEYPFHRSTSGADFWVLHGMVGLEGSEGLRAPVAVNLSVTVREVLPSLEAKDT